MHVYVYVNVGFRVTKVSSRATTTMPVTTRSAVRAKPRGSAQPTKTRAKRKLDEDVPRTVFIMQGFDDDDDDDYCDEEGDADQRKYLSRADQAYFDALDKGAQESIEAEELRIAAGDDSTTVPVRFRVLRSALSPEVKAKVLKSMDDAYRHGGGSAKMMHRISGMLDLPLGKYAPLPTACNRDFLDGVRKHLDKTVYGMAKAKHRVLLSLAKWVKNPSGSGVVIGLQGDKGCGKTCLALELGRAIGLPLAFLSLGGQNDVSDFIGMNYTYEGSRWGSIAEKLMQSKCMNPVMCFDELDKVGGTRYGAEVTNMLVHLMDSSQNDRFQDRFFDDVPLDLSGSLMVVLFNEAKKIPPVLLDRITVVKVPGYGPEEKLAILRDHVLPKVLADHAMTSEDVVVSDDVMRYIVLRSSGEKPGGVRDMKRGVEAVVGNANMARVMDPDAVGPIVVTQAFVDSCTEPWSADDAAWKNSMMYS